MEEYMAVKQFAWIEAKVYMATRLVTVEQMLVSDKKKWLLVDFKILFENFWRRVIDTFYSQTVFYSIQCNKNIVNRVLP